jgi:hypothetical protein
VYLPVGDKIEIPVGEDWMRQFSAVRNKLAMVRGTRPGIRVRLSWGATGFNYQVPKTTCADIKAGYSTWIWKLIEAAQRERNWDTESKYRAAKDLGKLSRAVDDLCAADPAIEFPQNDLFWALTKRAAIDADSIQAVPSAWELIVEAGEEAAREAYTGLPPIPDFLDVIPKIDWTKIVLWSVAGFGGYMLLKGRK